MNVRLKKTFTWYAAIVYGDRFLINHYTAEISMITVTADNDEQNIAYERTKMFIRDVIDGSVMISQNSPNLGLYQKIGTKILVLPEEPFDQIVGMMLYLKLNAVMENRMVVTDVELQSHAGDTMNYLHSAGESVGPLEQEGWWLDSRPTWANSPEKPRSKIVNLSRSPEWADHGLDWTDGKNSSDSVVFAKFDRNEDK